MANDDAIHKNRFTRNAAPYRPGPGDFNHFFYNDVFPAITGPLGEPPGKITVASIPLVNDPVRTFDLDKAAVAEPCCNDISEYPP